MFKFISPKDKIYRYTLVLLILIKFIIWKFDLKMIDSKKIFTTGGGGMIVSNNQKQAEHIKFLINQARDASKGYYHPEVGFNYRMTNIEVSLGLA